MATLPQALLSILGGVIADRFDTRTVMATGQLLNAAILCIGAALWGRLPALWLLIAIAVAFGSITGLTQPATATLSRQLVATDDLATVSGWNQIAGRLARLAGAPLGAWLVATYDLPAVMLLNAGTYTLAAIALLLIVRPRYRLRSEEPESWPAATSAGLSYLRRDAAARTFVIGLCGLNVFSTPLISLGLPLRITDAGWPATTLGTLEAVFAGCAILGSLTALALQPTRRAFTAFLLLAGQGSAYALIAIPTLPAVAVGMAIIGVVAGCASVWLSAEFVRTIDPAYLGRVFSISTLGDLVLIPILTPAFGALTNRIGIDTSPVVLAAGMTLLCLWIATRPTIRHPA